MAAQWLSQDPRNGAIVAYDAATTKTIETAFSSSKKQVGIKLGGTPFTIDFGRKIQKNQTGGSRPIFRNPPPPGWPAPPGAPGPAPSHPPPGPFGGGPFGGGPFGGPAPGPPAQVPPTVPVLDGALCKNLLTLLDDIEKRVNAKMEKGFPHFLDLDIITPAEVHKLAPVYTAIQSELNSDKIKSTYGFSGGDAASGWLSLDQPVPHYYANVSGQSIWQRKALSIGGLQNLLKYGGSIWKEMGNGLFSACPASYGPGPEGVRCGPERMRYWTGNAVDLDTVVLRCSDGALLKTINHLNAKDGLPTYGSGDQFGSSKQAREIALDAAGPLIADFCDTFKIDTPAKKQARNLVLNPGAPIHIAQSSGDRGTHAVWQYVNVGQNSFHVNVPCIKDVYGALMKAPLYTIRAFLIIHDSFPAGPDRSKWIEEFFEDGISDTCFNQKWKAIEFFCDRLDSLGSIGDKIAKVQMENQAALARVLDLDGDDDGPEIQLTHQLLKGAHGRDESGKVRLITKEDVATYLRRSY